MKNYIFILLLFLNFLHPSSEYDKIKVDISSGSLEFFYQNSAGLLIAPLKLKNVSDKTIKYLTVEVNAYNAVGDLMVPELGERRCKITGPIKPLASYKTHLDCSTYYLGLVNNLKIRVVDVEYIDGTIHNTPTEFYHYTYSRQENDKFAIKMGIGVAILLTIFAFSL